MSWIEGLALNIGGDDKHWQPSSRQRQAPILADCPLRIRGQHQTQQLVHILSNLVKLDNKNEGVNLKTWLGFKEWQAL